MPASTPLPGATLGGGLVSPSAAAPITGATVATPEQLIPVLQNLIATVNALIAALGGNPAGAPIANASSGAGALGAPTPASTSGGGGHGGHDASPSAGPHSKAKSHHGMKIIQRTKPENEALANANFNAVYGSFAKQGRAGLDFKNNQTHGYLNADMIRTFKAAHPGLPVPEALVFRAGSNTPIGASYRTNDPNFDLGKGTRHDHTGDKGTSQMLHIWFTPGDMNFAFADVAYGMTGSTAAAMKRRGYPT